MISRQRRPSLSLPPVCLPDNGNIDGIAVDPGRWCGLRRNSAKNRMPLIGPVAYIADAAGVIPDSASWSVAIEVVEQGQAGIVGIDHFAISDVAAVAAIEQDFITQAIDAFHSD